MIRVRRPAAEPPSLTTARAQHLPNAAALPGAAGPLIATLVPPPPAAAGSGHCQPARLIPTDTLTGYQTARPDLYAARHGKCYACEKWMEAQTCPVGHFRPKVSYWWLAWIWENLLFSCERCNTHKGAQFPLASPRCLQPDLTAPGYGEHPPGTSHPGPEQPLLLDPADPAEDDPLDHIRFQPDDPADPDTNWRPIPRHGSLRGAAMIAVCRLDRPELLDACRTASIQLQTSIERIEAARATPDLPAVWDQICRRSLSARAPFAALHHDILDHHFPAPFRAAHGLSLAIRY